MRRPSALPQVPDLAANALKVVTGALLVGVVALYLAGYFFLWSVHGNPFAATPLTVPRYAYYHGDNTQVRTRLVASSGVAVGLLGVAGLLGFLPRRRSLHGDARWASKREIRKAGLLSDTGLILGEYGRHYLTLGGQQGVLLAAPPRSGKGVGVVIPNLLSFPGSVVCVDIKRENWEITAGYRAACGQKVFLFDPFSPEGRTARWNPLGYVSEDPDRRINDLQRIAEMLYPDPNNSDPFWTASARSLFLGVALYLFETPSRPRTLGEILRQGMASGEEGFGEHWKRLIEGRREGSRPLSAECVRALYDVIDLAPVTASSIRKTFTSRLDLWQNPILDAATSENDFDLRNLRSAQMSIYVGVNPDDLHRLRSVINLFFQQAIGLQTRELPEHNPALKHQVLMLLDEFSALGRIPILAESIGYLPGYNVRTMLVIQTPSQLRDVYGPNAAETMVKTLASRVVFAPKDYADAKEISDELGMTTVKVKSTSRSAWGSGKGPSVSFSEQRRPLLLPQEVKELGPNESIIFYEGLRPIRAKKVRYFSDPSFKVRLRLPPEVQSIIAGTEVGAKEGARDDAPESTRVIEEVIEPPPPAKASRLRRRRRKPDSAPKLGVPSLSELDIDAAVQAHLKALTGKGGRERE